MDLDFEMAQVLAAMSVLSEVSAPSYEPSVHGGTPDRSPKGPRESTYDVFRRKWEAAGSDVRRSKVLEEATEELRTWKVRQDRTEAAVSVDELILSDGLKHDPEIVGQRFNVPPALVRRTRSRHGLDTETGMPLVRLDRSRQERAQQARELRERGLSQRQIGMMLGVDVATVCRDLAL